MRTIRPLQRLCVAAVFFVAFLAVMMMQGCTASSQSSNSPDPPPGDTTAPTAPALLTSTPLSSTLVALSWTASTDNVAVTTYKVERCTGNGCTSFTQIASVSATNFSDSGLLSGTTYGYRVRAADAAGSMSAYSNVASATTPAPASITVLLSPTATTVTIGGAQNFTATVQGDPQNKGVSWSLSGSGCSGSTCGTLSNVTTTAVTYNAPGAVPSPATITLIATSVTDSTKSATATITATANPVVSVSISPGSTSAQAGTGTAAFTASVSNDSQNKGVTWTLGGSGCSGSSCGTLSGATATSVIYHAPASAPSPASVTLTATSVADASKTASATITVTAAITVSVSPASVSLNVTATQQFTATVQNDAQNLGVTWSVNGVVGGNATVGTIGTSGLYTAPVSAPASSVTVTAKSKADTTRSGSATVTVLAAVSVSISPSAATVQAAHGQSFTASVSNDPGNQGVTWKLSGSGCSGTSCGTLSNVTATSVTYTAPASLPSPANVSLTATSKRDTTKSAAATITLTTAATVSVSVSPTTISLATGGTQNFTATVQNDSQNKGVSWSLSGAGCSGTSCGTLSNVTTAAVTYHAPATAPSPATITLTATSIADGSKVASSTITLTALVTVSVSPPSVSLNISATQQFTATVQNDSQNKGVSWSLSGAGCSGTSCGTLSNVTTTTVTYQAPATAPSPATITLTATSIADGSKKAASTITVTAGATNISVTVSPKRGGLATSQTLSITATLTNDTGNQGVTWSFSSTGSTSGGGFSPTSSTSGNAVTFTAPSAAGVVTITASAVGDNTKTATATIGVTDLAGVTTYHNNLSRDGTNQKEYALTTANVATGTFGKLFSCAADGALYAQPLWIPKVSIGGGTHNVIIAASMRDTVYAFDADKSPCTTYWSKTLIPSGETFGNSNDLGSSDIYPDIGILGTPVIDSSSNTVYLVSKTKDGSGLYHQRLHALSLTDGSEKFGGPVDLTDSITVAGTGDVGDSAASCFSSNGQVPFCPMRENQRPGLALNGGVVYVAWASHGDVLLYHGWVIGFDASTLARVSTFNSSPNGRQSGIWMSGGAPAIDSSGNLFVITGNGNFNGTTDFGDSLLKLSSSLAVSDSFTPSVQSTLDGNDQDFGSGGAVVLVNLPSAPTPHLLIGAGKGAGFAGTLYVLNRDNLGGYQQAAGGGDKVVQSFNIGKAVFSTAGFWQNTLYVGGFGSPLFAYALNPSTGQLNAVPTSQTANSFTKFGSTPSISSSGSSNGIVWAIDFAAYGTNDGGFNSAGPAVLHAYDATDLSNELWNSTMGSGNTAGNAVKFTVPTVANGKVYVGTRGNDTTINSPTTRGEIDVYGLLPN